MSGRPVVLSVQTPLLGNGTYAELLRRMLRDSERTDFRAVWSDEERRLHEREPLGRILYRLCFTFSRSAAVRARNADLYAMRYELGASYWAARVIARRLASDTPAVLHLHTQALALLATGTMRRLPTVISGDMTSHRTAEQFTDERWRWTHAVQHVLEGRAYRAAAAIVSFSSYAAKSVTTHYGVSPEKVSVISPGVDLSRFGDVGRSREERNDPIKRFLFVGGEFERKGGLDLVDVFLSRFGDRGDVELHVVTSADVRLPTHPRIIAHTDVVAYTPAWFDLYDRASVLVFPTRREAYGLVYLEAAAARLPVVGSTVGAGPELLSENETGYVVSPGDRQTLADRMTRLIDDRELRQRFGIRARARAERDFDARENALRLEAIFLAAARAAR